MASRGRSLGVAGALAERLLMILTDWDNSRGMAGMGVLWDRWFYAWSQTKARNWWGWLQACASGAA